MHRAPTLPSFYVEVGGHPLPSKGRYGAGEADAHGAIDGREHERTHALTCIGVVVSGYFDFRTPNGAACVGPGAFIFGHARETFAFRYHERDGARRCVIAMSDEFAGEAAEGLGLERITFATAAVQPRRTTAALYGDMRRVAASPAPHEETVFEILSTALSLGREPPHGRPCPRLRERLRRIARCIDACYARDFELAELAEMAQLSKFHFLRAFKSEFGESPARYVTAARMRAAIDRLVHTREPIASIALDVGFNDVSHFNATFRATFGAAPRTWRAGPRRPRDLR